MDGDYLPNSSLDVKQYGSFQQARKKIMETVKLFVTKYEDSVSDFSTIIVKDLKTKRGSGTTSQAVAQIDEASVDDLIGVIETDLLSLFEEGATSKTGAVKREITFAPEVDWDDDKIVVEADGKKLRVYFNQAPNMNRWDQLDIVVTPF
jgi:hypothetical protein